MVLHLSGRDAGAKTQGCDADGKAFQHHCVALICRVAFESAYKARNRKCNSRGGDRRCLEISPQRWPPSHRCGEYQQSLVGPPRSGHIEYFTNGGDDHPEYGLYGPHAAQRSSKVWDRYWQGRRAKARAARRTGREGEGRASCGLSASFYDA